MKTPSSHSTSAPTTESPSAICTAEGDIFDDEAFTCPSPGTRGFQRPQRRGQRRRLAAIGAIALTLTAPISQAFTVYDPTVHTQIIISTAQEIAKYVEMIQNQVKQIRALEQEVATLQRYVSLFGNPASARPSSLPALEAHLHRPEVGVVLGDLLRSADGAAAMIHNGNGIFAPVGETFVTPEGVRIQRREATYRPVAAIQMAADNYLVVAADAAVRRTALKEEIAKTTTALASAATDAEVQKLAGTLVGLGTALQGTEQELTQATSAAIVQDIATKADERRQSEARREERAAEIEEATAKMATSFRLLTGPVAFPTR